MASAEVVLRSPEELAQSVERVLIQGDLSKLTTEERVFYYKQVCESIGVNPFTKPFDYLETDGKISLYANKDCGAQLRKIHGISTQITARELIDGIYVVTARAITSDGRTDDATGAVPLIKESGQWKTAQSGKRYFEGSGTYQPLRPEDKANAIMKAETKAKRRATLSVCGLGFLDESEIDGIPAAKTHPPDDVQVPSHPALSAPAAKVAEARQPEPQQKPPAPKPAAPSTATGARQAFIQTLWRRMSKGEMVSVINELRAGYDQAVGSYKDFDEIWHSYPWKTPSGVQNGAPAREMVSKLYNRLQDLREASTRDIQQQPSSDDITDDPETWIPPTIGSPKQQTLGEEQQPYGTD